MNVRVDWEPGGAPSPRRPSRQGSRGPGGPKNSRARRRNLQLVAAVGIGLLVTAVAAIAVHPAKSKAASGGSASSTASASATASGGSAAAGGLPRGSASAFGLDGSTRVSGLPRGFTHTESGAVEAATTALAATFTLDRMDESDRHAYLSSAFGGHVPAGSDTDASTWQQQNGLNAQGQLLDPATGQPSTTQRFTSLCHPELGAYKVVSTAADAVTVDVWQVCITGTIGDGPSNLDDRWYLGQLAMKWAAGDWVVASTGDGGYSTAPQPQGDQVVTTFAQRAQILSSYGSGWELYSDASESTPAEMEATQ